ncbi:unnamed protein product [Rotaria sordida]|uniref:Uncharacterized protein n=1 Tax=Rotaria sordida TaxID=392033 RepID=A0A813Q354_9BILA|nr:unnamed protein product [Rotaria sordida]
MGTENKTFVQQPSSKVTVVMSKNDSTKKSNSSHHKSKHNKQRRSSSTSSNPSTEHGRNSTSRKKHEINNSSEKNSKSKMKLSSTVELCNNNNNNAKSSNENKKQSNRSKHNSSESPYQRNNNIKKLRSRSKSQSSRSRSNERSPPRHRYPNPSRLHNRGGRMLYNPPPMMTNSSIRNNNNSNRRSNDNSSPQLLLGGYRPPLSNFHDHNSSINNATYLHNVHNMANMIQNMSNLMQQKQKSNSNIKYSNANNPNNHFYQQFRNNYKKLKSGKKISNLYQASFPAQHIPREMNFNFRLLGRNIFTASDDDDDDEHEHDSTTSEKHSKQKQRHHSTSQSSNSSEDERREEEEEATVAAIAAGKSKSSPILKNSIKQKRSSTKSNRNHTSSSIKTISNPRELLTNSNNLSTLLAGIIQSENSEIIANTLASAAAIVNNKRERTKKYLDKKVQKFKNYARLQQTQSIGTTDASTTNPDETKKKIDGLARRLRMKTVGLHEDYELQGMKHSDDSSVDSDTSERHHHRHHSSGSTSERSKDKDIDSDTSTNPKRQDKLKKLTKKKNSSSSQIIDSSDDEHRSNGNDSDGSMLNLNENLKPIGYYIKDRERMLHEMFRCIHGHKLQAILPDVLKINLYDLFIGTATQTRSIDEIKARCLDQLDILSKKRIRTILLAQPMISSSGTEDSTDEDEQNTFTLYPHLKSSLDITNNNAANVTTTATSSMDDNTKSLPNGKFRPVQMYTVTENSSSSTTTIHNNLSTPAIIGVNEDVNDYYEDFKKIKKLPNLRRNEQDDELILFPDQTGKILQPIGINLPKFEFKPITSLTHNKQTHFNARRIANRQKQQQQQQNEIRQEIDDLLNIDDFVLPNGERPLSSVELSINKEYQYGLPPKIQRVEPPKKGSLGDLLKRKKTEINERSPSPIISKRIRHRQRSYSLSSSSSERMSRDSLCEMIESNTKIDNDEIDMSDLSKLLDLNEEDELLLLQIEVEQEERNLRRQEKRKRKEEKKTKKNNLIIIKQCLNNLIEKILFQENKKFNYKRPFDDINNFDDILKKIKI